MNFCNVSHYTSSKKILARDLICREELEKDEPDRGWRELYFTVPRGKWLSQQQWENGGCPKQVHSMVFSLRTNVVLIDCFRFIIQ